MQTCPSTPSVHISHLFRLKAMQRIRKFPTTLLMTAHRNIGSDFAGLAILGAFDFLWKRSHPTRDASSEKAPLLRGVCVNPLTRCKTSPGFDLNFTQFERNFTTVCRGPRLHSSAGGQRSDWCLERICSPINCTYLVIFFILFFVMGRG